MSVKFDPKLLQIIKR